MCQKLEHYPRRGQMVIMRLRRAPRQNRPVVAALLLHFALGGFRDVDVHVHTKFRLHLQDSVFGGINL